MNENIFETIDNKHKAYWLGFLFADGGIRGSFLKLILAQEDENQIDKFANFMGVDKSIKKYYGPYKSNCQVQVHLYINSKKIISDLAKYGCVENKTFKIRLPKFYNEELDLSFLCGFYDGDGSAKLPLLTGGKVQFLEDIAEYYNLDTKPIKDNYNRYTSYSLAIGKLYRKMLEIYPDSIVRKRKIYVTEYDPDNKWHPSNKGLVMPTRKFNPSKEELEKLVWEMPVTKIAELYKVSDSAIIKRCRLLKINKPTSGYWTKVKFGKIK